MRVLSCPTCGIVYCVPEDWRDAKLRQHDRGDEDVRWWCPNGHTAVFSGEPRIPKLEREVRRLEQQIARVEDERRDAERALLTAQRDVKRREARAAAGVCPDCHRTFQNMARHMKTKHPEQPAVRLLAT